MNSRASDPSLDRPRRRAAVLATWMAAGVGTTACGHSNQEWQQQARELAVVRAQAKTQAQALAACEGEQQRCRAELESVTERLQRSGVRLEALDQDLDRQGRAVREFETRAAQITDVQARMQRLAGALRDLSAEGITLAARDNRVRVVLPVATVFDGGGNGVSPAVRRALQVLAEALASEVDAGRTLQIRVYERRASTEAWRRAALRAVALTRALLEQSAGRLTPDRVSAAGFLLAADAPSGGPSAEIAEIVLLPTAEETLPVP